MRLEINGEDRLIVPQFDVKVVSHTVREGSNTSTNARAVFIFIVAGASIVFLYVVYKRFF